MSPTAMARDSTIEAKLPDTGQREPKRRPPAYQTYASDDIASEFYYGLTLQSRGLFDAMLRVIWVDGSVSSNPRVLAKAVRAELAEVTSALVPELIGQFTSVQHDPSRLTFPELERQRANLERQRELQRRGGKDGAARRNAKRKSDLGAPAGQPIGPEKNRPEEKRTPPLGEGPLPKPSRQADPWVKEYEDSETEVGGVRAPTSSHRDQQTSVER